MAQGKRLMATMGDSDTESETTPRRGSSSGKAKRRKPVEDGGEDAGGATYLDQAEEIASIRKKQQRVLEEIQNNRDDLEVPSSSMFETLFADANDAFKKGARKDVQVASKDATAMRKFAEIMHKQVTNIGSSNASVNPTILSTRLKQFFGTEGKSEVDFARLGQEVKVFFRSVPACDFMLGAIEVQLPEKKEKAPRAPRSRVQDHPVEKPEDLSAAAAAGSKKSRNGAAAASSSAAAETTNDMFTLHKDLQNELSKAVMKKGRVSMFETVVDPRSFTQTVENIFALTFLVKDGVMSLEVDEEDKIPHVEAVKLNNELNVPQSAVQKSESQFIATFSMADWERVCEEFGIEQGLMKHRELNIYDDVKNE